MVARGWVLKPKIGAKVPWPSPVPAPGASKTAMAPFRARTKPCRAKAASRVNPVISPAGVISKGMVPWSAPVPAPGASNVVKVGWRAVAERPSPSVARQTTRAKRPIDFLKYRVVIFLYTFFWLRLDCLTENQFHEEPGTNLYKAL